MSTAFEAQLKLLRSMVRGAYDLQKVRMAIGLRLVGNFKRKLGQEPSEKETELDADAKAILKDLRDSFKRLTDGVAKNRILPAREGFTGDQIISDYTELLLVDQYLGMSVVEDRSFAQLERVLNDFPIWTQFLLGVKGVGPAMGAVIITEFDIHKARYPSSLWAYAGLDVGPDGLGRSRRKEHLVMREYQARDGTVKERVSITHNPFLKTKLMGVLAGSFLRTASPYAELYYSYKHRLESDPTRVKMVVSKWSATEWRKGRIHEAAKRYMVKQFLKDLYNAWRPLEGLPVAPTYQEAKLGHVHGAGPQA